MADSTREPYDLRIGQLLFDYRDFTVMGQDGGFGYRAQLRAEDGRGHVGPEVTARNPDELAGKMDGLRIRFGRTAPRS